MHLILTMVVFVCLSSLCSALAVQLSYIFLAAATAQGWTVSQSMEIPVQWQKKSGSNEKHALPKALCDTVGHLQKGKVWWAHLVLVAIWHLLLWIYFRLQSFSLVYCTLSPRTDLCTHYNSLHSLTNHLFPFQLLIVVFLCCRYWWMCFRFSPV